MVTGTDLIAPANTAAVPRAATVSQVTAVEQARAVAEVLAAVQVAQQCPRDTDRAWREMETACQRFGLAQRAFYSVKNRGTGPSVHLARELARIWGNLDYGVRELRRDDRAEESEVQAFCWDQQTNVRSTRSMIHPHIRMVGGKRVPLIDITDIYLSNQNLGARAVRECILAALPRDFVDRAEDLCRRTLEAGDGTPVVERVTAMLAGFKGIGVVETQIAARLGKPRRDWGPVDVADLGVVFRSIRNGETTAEEEFPAPATTAEHLLADRPVDIPQDSAVAASNGNPTVATIPVDSVVDTTADSGPPGITAAQSRKLHTLLGKTGRGDRDEGLKYLTLLLGRDVGTTKDLTVGEARIAIDDLEADLAAREAAAAEVNAEAEQPELS